MTSELRFLISRPRTRQINEIVLLRSALPALWGKRLFPDTKKNYLWAEKLNLATSTLEQEKKILSWLESGEPECTTLMADVYNISKYQEFVRAM